MKAQRVPDLDAGNIVHVDEIEDRVFIPKSTNEGCQSEARTLAVSLHWRVDEVASSECFPDL